MDMADAGRRAVELDRDFKLQLSNGEFDALVGVLLADASASRRLAEAGRDALLDAIRAFRAAA